MTSFRITGGRCLSPDGTLAPATISVTEGTIVAVAAPESADSNADRAIPTIDATGLVVAPGFVDLQINGGYGHDLRHDPESVWELGRRLPATGVTSFLPTIISSPPSATDGMLRALRARPPGYRGAEPLGAHFEGPMLNPQRAGAHRVSHLVEPSLNAIDGWSQATGVRLVTIAPELPGAVEIIAELAGRGVTVSAGHSMADRDQAEAGVDAGADMVTHLFNAMAAFGHRSPNLAGVALADRRITAGLIVDGIHVDPVAVAATWRAKGPDRLALVTDAVAAMGQPSGTYAFDGGMVTADGESVRNADGALAGSLLTMDRAVANLVAFSGCRPEAALAAAGRVPADAIDERRRGRLTAGAVADIVLVDSGLAVQVTIGSGCGLYVADHARPRIDAALAGSW